MRRMPYWILAAAVYALSPGPLDAQTQAGVEIGALPALNFDADEGFGDQDARILSLVRERGCAAALLLNKWDLVEARGADAVRQVETQLDRRLKSLAHHPVLRVSARTGSRVARIFPLLRRLAQI